MTRSGTGTPPPSLWFGALTSTTDPAFRERAIVSGHGCYAVDTTGREYLDARSALWNATLGYDNRRVIEAITAQLHRLPVGQIIRHEQPPRVSLDYAERLVRQLPATLTQVRFCTTGAQAVEGAVMLSRFVRRQSGESNRRDVIALWDAYHGIGGLASALTGEPPLHDIEGSPPAGVHHIPPGDLDALRDTITRVGADRITAVIMEPILGSGFVELSRDYLAEVQALCRHHRIHLILDEVTTGFGRAGTLTVTGGLRLEPDLLVLSKGITAGHIPLAAIAVTADIAAAGLSGDVVFPHGSTSDGHPLAMAAADAVLTELVEGRVLANVIERGAQLTAELRALAAGLPAIGKVHGPGLMVAVSLVDESGAPAAGPTMLAVKNACRDAGLLVSLCGDMVMLTPPLVITAGDVTTLVARLADGIRAAMPGAVRPQARLAHAG